MSDISETAMSGIPNYDMYVSAAFDAMEFRGKTLSQWEEEISFADLDEHIDFIELKKINYDFVNKSKIIMNNLSYAKTALKGCEMQYEAQLGATKVRLLQEFKETNPNARAPSIDALSTRAQTICIESLIAKEIAEMFLLFWQSQYDKIKIIDSRLSGIGYLIGLEVRNTHM